MQAIDMFDPCVLLLAKELCQEQESLCRSDTLQLMSGAVMLLHAQLLIMTTRI